MKTCIDEAPAMLGLHSGLLGVSKIPPQAKSTYFVIYRYALASKTLPFFLQTVLDLVINLSATSTLLQRRAPPIVRCFYVINVIKNLMKSFFCVFQ